MLLSCAIVVSCRGPRWAPTSAYTARTLAGFRVLVSPSAMSDPRTGEFLDTIGRGLERFRGSVRADARDALRDVVFWVELDERERAMAGYHGADWIARHGLNPDKARAIEIADRD